VPLLQGTNDQSGYNSVPAALAFVEGRLGGWGAVREYCTTLAEVRSTIRRRRGGGLRGISPAHPSIPGWCAALRRWLGLRGAPARALVCCTFPHRLSRHRCTCTRGLRPALPADAPPEAVEAAYRLTARAVNERMAYALLAVARIQGDLLGMAHSRRTPARLLPPLCAGEYSCACGAASPRSPALSLLPRAGVQRAL